MSAHRPNGPIDALPGGYALNTSQEAERQRLDEQAALWDPLTFRQLDQWATVAAAIFGALESAGADRGYGRRLPAAVRAAGLADVSAEGLVPIGPAAALAPVILPVLDRLRPRILARCRSSSRSGRGLSPLVVRGNTGTDRRAVATRRVRGRCGRRDRTTTEAMT
ncbi:MAG TPA: hypothetical protein VKB57_15040 [Acidimicrobiales bacterium]|nr:hypothetical protein [Acidimicrobiales bacterium]